MDTATVMAFLMVGGTVLVIVVLVLYAMLMCPRTPPAGKAAPVAEGEDSLYRKESWNGHVYVLRKSYNAHQPVESIVHDPDCPCRHSSALSGRTGPG